MPARGGTGSTSRGRRSDATPVALQPALDIARNLLAKGEFDSAERLLTQLQGTAPSEPRVLHLLGALRHRQGNMDEAGSLLERAVSLLPASAEVWNDVGNVRAALLQADQAAAAYSRAIDLAGSNRSVAGPLYNLAGLYIDSDPAESEHLLRRALRADPDCVAAWHGLARALTAQKKLSEAFDASCRGTLLAPEGASRDLVGRALLHFGEHERARQHYRAWAEAEPLNPVPLHHLKAIEDPRTTEGASRAYVESTFDRFAPTFERKLHSLGYRVPDLIAEMVATLHPRACGNLGVLDAGCGTGLCGPVLRPYARKLTGVDLSDRMLDAAAARNCFDELHKDDLVALARRRPRTFDLVVCADTFCYFAALDEPFAAIATAIEPGGHLVFTVEAIDDDDNDHELRASGRFAHSPHYVQRILQQAGLKMVTIRRETLRMEALKPVSGWLVAAECPAT